MALQEVVNVSTDAIATIGHVALYLQALGIVLVIYIIYQIISAYTSWKRMKEIYNIKEDMKRIENKIDLIISRQKK